jgi:hypothetical protein
MASYTWIKKVKSLKRSGDEEEDEEDRSEEDSEEDSADEEESDADEHDDESKPDQDVILEVGTAVKANYRAKEQFEGRVTWYDGKIAAVHTDKAGNITYDVEYDDGDYEDGVERGSSSSYQAKDQRAREGREKDRRSSYAKAKAPEKRRKRQGTSEISTLVIMRC